MICYVEWEGEGTPGLLTRRLREMAEVTLR